MDAFIKVTLKRIAPINPPRDPQPVPEPRAARRVLRCTALRRAATRWMHPDGSTSWRWDTTDPPWIVGPDNCNQQLVENVIAGMGRVLAAAQEGLPKSFFCGTNAASTRRASPPSALFCITST